METNISFIFPSVFFGGHEIMAIEIIKEIERQSKNKTISYVNSKNISLKIELEKSCLSYKEFDGSYSILKPVSHFFSFENGKVVTAVLKDAATISSGRPIYLIQGSIELGCDFLFWSKWMNVSIVSYIPFAHSAKRLNRRFSLIRELLAKFYYNMCDHYITISDVFKENIIQYNKRSEVNICHNFISSERVNRNKLSVSKEIDSSTMHIFVVGRIMFLHKGQDFAIKCFSDLLENYGKELSREVTLHFVGDGPDLPQLKSYAENSLICKNRVYFHGWVDKWWETDFSPDLLVITSHFEGVPLVMLEAISLNIPIISSNVDGMIDYLYPHALFDLSIEGDLTRLLYESINNKDYLRECANFRFSNDINKLNVSSFL